MRYFWLTITAWASLASLMMAAEIAVNLSGTWIFDPTHSQIWHTSPSLRKMGDTIGNGYPDNREDDKESDAILLASPETRIQYITLQIIQTNGELQTIREFTLDEKKQAVSQKFSLDGSQCINIGSNGEGEFVSRANWKNSKLINSGIQTITKGMKKRELAVVEVYSISKDGKRLTINTLSADPRGVLHFKQVFLRK